MTSDNLLATSFLRHDAATQCCGFALTHVPPQSGGAAEGLSLEALRRAATGPSAAERRDAERRRATLNNAFRTAPFDQLQHITQPKVNNHYSVCSSNTVL